MPDEPLANHVPTTAELSEVSDVEVLDAADAADEVERAVAGRRGIARRYVLRIRRRNPEATPAQVVAVLERHYLAAISTAGAVVTVGSLAAEIGISYKTVANTSSTLKRKLNVTGMPGLVREALEREGLG